MSICGVRLGLQTSGLRKRPAPHSPVSYRVPFRSGSLFLKFRKLLPIVDGDEELPDEQSGKADEQNGPHH